MNENMHKPNPEGVTAWDALCMIIVPTSIFVILLNVGMYIINHPDIAERIAKFIFPLAFC